LRTTQRGMPKTVSAACWRCEEWRRADHCRCTRESTPGGRKPRKFTRGALEPEPRPRARARLEEAVQVEVARPRGRPSPSSCELVDLRQWWSTVVAEVGGAREVELASYMFDDKSLFDVLARGLRRKQLVLNVYIDAEALGGQTPRSQRKRLTELLALGGEEGRATVWRCKTWRQCSYHCKALIVDRRVLYTGSANFTENSRRNRETVYRMTGPVVEQVLRQLAEDRGAWGEWDGSR
jgi:hypothetical protein